MDDLEKQELLLEEKLEWQRFVQRLMEPWEYDIQEDPNDPQ